ncbi:hypothetical protein LXL04_005029 [Taraxacum kok-saghyz]
MDEHPAPPRRRRIVSPQTTNGILMQTSSIFSTTNNLLMFLLLSIFLLFLRAGVEFATDFLISFIDNDRSIKSLIYRIHGPPNPTTIITRRHPFPHITSVPILDDDGYFSEDGEFHSDSSLPKPQLNATLFIIDPQFRYSNFVSDNGIRASEIVRSSTNITFGLIEIIEENIVVNGSNDSAPFNESVKSNSEFQSYRSDLEYHDYTALMILISAFSASYWIMVLAVVHTYSKVHGIIFIMVLNDFCETRNSFAINFSNVWIVMADSRRKWWEAVNEGCHLPFLQITHAAIREDQIVGGKLIELGFGNQVQNGFYTSLKKFRTESQFITMHVAMNEHPAHPPPPRRIIVHQTTIDILKKTTAIFSTSNNLLMFLLLSLFLFCLRANVEMATDFLTSFVDNEPSIKSYIHRIHCPPNSTSMITTRRLPFLHLSTVGILDDDYFTGDYELNRRLFGGSLPKPQINATSFILDSFDPQLGFSNFVSDNGIRASETVRSGARMTFRLIEINEKEENIAIDEINSSAPFNESDKTNADFQSLLKRFDLVHHEFTALKFLVCAFCSSYWFMIVEFVTIYTTVHGIIYVSVLNDFIDKQTSFAITFSNGLHIGVNRVSAFIAIRCVVRDALTQLLAFWFFLSITDRYSLMKIFLRYKFMPYSNMLPWVKGFETEIDSFLLSWHVLDVLMSYVIAVSVWIAMADSRRNLREIVKEGCRLLKLMIRPAPYLKYIEGILCGPFVRSVITRSFGVLFAVAFQSLMEVYFMVAWMVYYLSLKSIDADSSGQPFGQRELEYMLKLKFHCHSSEKPIAMDDHPPPAPPPRIVILRTTTDILKHTAAIFFTDNNLLMLLFLSFILLSHRINTDRTTHAVTSYIDNDPSLKSIMYRYQGSPNLTSPTTAITTTRRHHRHPFLHVNESDYRFIGSLHKPQSIANATAFILDSFSPQFRFSNFVFDNGIWASETVRSTAKTTFRSIEVIEKEENVGIDFQFNIEHHDFTALSFSLGAFTASYGILTLEFVLTHSIIHGVIFLSVLNNFCRRYNSFAITFFNGCSLGLIRSSCFIILKYTIRYVFTHLLSVCYFRGIEDRYSLLKIFVRSMFMPWSILVPSVKGFKKESHDFILAWLIADFLLSFVLTMDPWIVMADPRKNFREIMEEGCHLLSLVCFPAFKLKCFEGIVCGPYVRYVIKQRFGDLFALAFKSFMEVYFMVAWMMYYLSVKSIDAESTGQPFSQRELKAMLEDLNTTQLTKTKANKRPEISHQHDKTSADETINFTTTTPPTKATQKLKIHYDSSAKPIAMNEHPAPAPPPLPPRIVLLRTTIDILNQTTVIFSTGKNLLMFLLLSFILLSHRLYTDFATHVFTSYIDDDPSVKSIMYRIQGSPNFTSPTSAITTTRRHHRQPFLQDNESDYRFIDSLHKPQSNANATAVILDSTYPQFRSSNFEYDNGIWASEIIEKEENVAGDKINDSAPFDIEHHEFTALSLPICAVIASYGILMAEFVFTHSLVRGVIFLSILNNFCRKYNSFAMTFYNGCSLGLIRSSRFIFLKQTIMDVFTHLLTAHFMVPLVKGFERETQQFVFAWVFADIVLSFVLAMGPWIVMADPRKNFREAMNEGCHLLSLVLDPALKLKSFEVIVCGPYGRFVLAQRFGDLFAIAFQSFMEVYFMVAWMMCYLSVKSIDANSTGQPFGQRELKAMLEDVRF